MHISRNDVFETEIHLFSADASDLGILAAMPMPQSFETDLGNGQPFLRESILRNVEGDIQLWRFRQGNGCIKLIVFND